MTQEQALAEYQAMFPAIAEELAVERERKIGKKHGAMHAFILWDYSYEGCRIVASSNRSWEHALAIAKSKDDGIWDEDDSPVADDFEEVSR